jgi:hypothetical protein
MSEIPTTLRLACVITSSIKTRKNQQLWKEIQLINKDQQEEHSHIQHVPNSTQQLNEIL